MSIKIFCDICGNEREVNQIRGVETVSYSTMRFALPQMNHQHFVCLECLGKIGFDDSGVLGLIAGENRELNKSDKSNKSDAGTDVAAREDGGRDVRKRRRGVEVVLTWKNNGEFEVFSSIAAACDRIAERTGAVISGADISHALLKERVYNADGFMVKYANSAGENNMLDRPDTPDRQGAEGEVPARGFTSGNELILENVGE